MTPIDWWVKISNVKVIVTHAYAESFSDYVSVLAFDYQIFNSQETSSTC